MPAVPSIAWRTPKDNESPAADAPAPSFFEQVTARARIIEDEDPVAVQMRLEEAYKPIMQALREKGVGDDAMQTSANVFGWDIPGTSSPDLDKIYRLAQENNVGDMKKDRAEFEAWNTGRKGEYNKNRAMIEKHGNWYVGLPMDMLASFKPEYGPLLMAGGGAATLSGAAIKEAVINVGFEGVDMFRGEEAREILDNPITGAEAVERLAMAGVGGAALGGIEFAWGRHIAPLLSKKIEEMTPLEKRLAKALEAENITVGTAVDDAIFNKVVNRLDDEGLADLAEVMIGLDSLTPNERGHIANIRREAQIDAMNPYIPDGAGIAAHRDGLAAAMQQILDNAPPSAPRARSAPVAASSGPLPRLRGGTAISSGNVAGDAFAVVKSRIGVVESGGNNAAKNPNSTATGTYQFVSGTWLKLYKSRFGSQGLSDSQIVAKRADGRLQEILMNDFMNANSKALRDGGHAVDAGNLYLAHFAGSGGASKLLRADPNASARSVLGDAVIKANPFLAKMNAADVINWAHRKMTGKGSVSQGSGGVSRETDIDPEADTRSWIERELAATDAERTRLDSEEDRDFAWRQMTYRSGQAPLTTQPEPFDISGGDAIDPLRPSEPVARLPDAPPVEVLAILPDLRAVVNDRTAKASLSDLSKLSREMGVPEADLRSGLIALAANGEVRMRYNKDAKPLFSRLPQDRGPVDMLKFIARKGGIRDDAGHDLRGMFEVKQTRNVKRNKGKGALVEVRQVKVNTTYMVPGGGYVVRDTGRSVDDMGEMLFEAGYFDTRPTEREVLDAISDSYSSGTKPYARGDEGAASALDYLEEQDLIDMRRDFDGAAEERGFALDDEAFQTAARMYADGDYENVGDAIVDMINREIQADRAATLYEAGDDYYDAQIEQFTADARAAGFDFDEGIDGPALLAGDAGAQSPSGRNAIGQSANQGPTELAPEAYKPFDDPGEGAGVTSQIDSMEHDLRAQVSRETDNVPRQNDPADMFGGATDVEKRQALERQAEGGLDNGKDQKPVGSDGGLFDPDSWAQTHFVDGDDGAPMTLAEFHADIEDEKSFFKTVRDCL